MQKRLVPVPFPGTVSREPDDPPMTVRVDRVDDEPGLRALAPEWDPLLEASSARNLFLSWEWVSLWWTIYGRGDRLHVLVEPR